MLDVAVVGTGPTGLAAALALARIGARVAVVGASADTADARTAALFTGSLNLLKHLGVWADVAGHSAPIAAIRIVDQLGGLLRAPEALFGAADADGGAVQDGVLGYNVPNGALAAALAAAVAAQPAIDWTWRTRVSALTADDDSATLSLEDGRRLSARLVVAADGRRSVCREGAGIAVRRWSHDQAALVTSFAHSRPHGDVSTEFHRPGGPLTVVPLPGRRSSLVWLDRPAVVEMLAGLGDDGFRAALEEPLQGLLGVVREVAPRRSFPLEGLTARAFGARRVALVGEAGHVFPPIGAQGLNLGLRDVAVLADVVADAIGRGSDPGGVAATGAYDAARQGDVATRTAAVTALGFSLTSGLAPVALGRGLGLHLLARMPGLKRRLVNEGLGPGNVAPALMRPPAAAGGA